VSWLNPLTWPIEPWLLLGLELAAVLYLWGGTRRVRASDPPLGWGTVQWRTAAFFGGLAVLFLALDTPIETLAQELFYAHMIQHLLLITVAAPLLVTGAPGLLIWRGLPLSIRRPLAWAALKSPALRPLRRLIILVTRPVGAWVLSCASLWFWHWPIAYDLTLRNNFVHHLEHAIFIGTGLLFWAQVIDQPPFHCRLGQVKRAIYVFLGALQSWALAAVLGFATVPFYNYATVVSRPAGISALADQQFGAGIMWVPGSITYSIVIILCMYRWLRDEEQSADRTPARPTRVAVR
jgi:putative membrane protein